MGDSAYSSLMMGVYVFVFIIATSLTVYLFTSTVTFADQAYEYGKVTTGDSVIETSSAPKYDTISGAELLTYYYNYKSPDKYGTTMTPNYDFRDIDDIDISRTYTLTYESANTGGKPVIRVSDVTSEVEPPAGGGPVVIDKRPTEPTIVTYPGVDSNITPGTSVEFEAYSSVTTSFLTNYMAKYYWRIDYSPEDGRPDYVRTSYGTMGTLSVLDDGDAIRFRDGVNMVYVTSEDALGNKSNTMSKRIEVGYLLPIINSIREVDSKVYDFGNINIESPTGTLVRLMADAESRNQGGYIQKYDWYVNDSLTQSGASDRFYKSYAPGEYRIKLVVHDSIQGTAEKTFTFTVNNMPAPVITCTNTSITNGSTTSSPDVTTNLTFNATLDPKYYIAKYMWTVDGVSHQTNGNAGLTLGYGWGTHNISVYGVNTEGIITNTATFAFTLKEEFVPFEQEYSYTGKYQTVSLRPGKYLLEVWGANGGADAEALGGNGGYARGEITINNGQSLYMYVGNQGTSSLPAAPGGWNGGGISGASGSSGGGGGASDIRLVDTTATYKTFYDIAPGSGLSDDTNATHFHGPYAKLKRGTYQVDIYGSGLDYIQQVWACTDIGATSFVVKNLVRTNTHISYNVVVPNDKDLMELNVLEYDPATKANISITNISASRLEDRIIVAGGGGGAGHNAGALSAGGDGGGLVGLNATNSGSNGGTQTAGGTSSCGNGDLGQGANHTSDGGAGGGGYFGGGAGELDNGGGGGSGYTGGVSNAQMQTGVGLSSGKAKITRLDNPKLVAYLTFGNDYFNGSTSYSALGQVSNTFTITFNATPTVTTALPTQGDYAYYSPGVKTYNYAVSDIHGGYLPVAGMGVSVGTNGVTIMAHSDNYYYCLLTYSANLSAKHDYKVVVNNRVPSLYIDGTLVKTGVTPVNCTTLIARPSVGSGTYGSYVGYANNFKFYNYAM